MDHYWWSGDASGPVPARRPSPFVDPAAVAVSDRSRPGDKGDESPLMVEDLTERERQVLGFVPTMLSAAEIGEELDISVNTVRAHLRSIYRKFGVSRRREAVTQARRHGLL